MEQAYGIKPGANKPMATRGPVMALATRTLTPLSMRILRYRNNCAVSASYHARSDARCAQEHAERR